jgi:hypothetical protein
MTHLVAHLERLNPLLDALAEPNLRPSRAVDIIKLSRRRAGRRMRWDQYARYDAALARLVDRYPDHVRLARYYATAPEAVHDWRLAVQRSNALIERWPENGDAYAAYCNAAVWAGDYANARAICRPAPRSFHKWSNAVLSKYCERVASLGLHEEARVAADALSRRFDWRALFGGRRHPDWWWQRIAQAAENQTSDSSPVARVRFIPLGEGCFSAFLGIRWGLRSYPPEQMPFDMLLSSADGIARALRNQLSDFIDPKHLKAIADTTGHMLAHHSNYRFVFNHERGAYWIDNDFEKLRERYDRAVANFLERGRSGPRVYVFYSERVFDAAALEDAVGGLCRDDRYRLVVIYGRQHQLSALPVRATSRFLAVQRPNPSRTWLHSDNWETEKGHAFQRQIHDFVLAAMREVDPQRAPAATVRAVERERMAEASS